MGKMSKGERIAAAIAGQPVDRMPISFWYHFPLEHPSGEPLAMAEIGFYKTYDIDFLKVMHDIPYELPEGMTAVEKPKDWLRLGPLDPRKGNFGEQLKALHLIQEQRGDDGPVLDTIFNPYNYADKISGGKLMQHLEEDPDSVQQGLAQIARNLADYSVTAIDRGLSGIYFAQSGAIASVMPEEVYRTQFLKHDYTVLEAVSSLSRFNVLHIHGAAIYFDLVKDLPCDAISWSSGITPPTLAEARMKTDRCLLTGIDETRIRNYTPEQAAAEVKNAIAEAGREKLIVASGCAVPTDTPEEVLLAARRAVEG